MPNFKWPSPKRQARLPQSCSTSEGVTWAGFGLRVQATKATQMVVGAAKQTNGIEGGGRGNMERGECRETRTEGSASERVGLVAQGLPQRILYSEKLLYSLCVCVWVCLCVWALSCDVAYNRIVKKWQELGASEAIERGEGGGVASQGTGRASRTLTLCACQNDACNDTEQMPTRNPRSLRFQGTRNYNSSSNNNNNFFFYKKMGQKF